MPTGAENELGSPVIFQINSKGSPVVAMGTAVAGGDIGVDVGGIAVGAGGTDVEVGGIAVGVGGTDGAVGVGAVHATNAASTDRQNAFVFIFSPFRLAIA